MDTPEISARPRFARGMQPKCPTCNHPQSLHGGAAHPERHCKAMGCECECWGWDMVKGSAHPKLGSFDQYPECLPAPA